MLTIRTLGMLATLGMGLSIGGCASETTDETNVPSSTCIGQPPATASEGAFVYYDNDVGELQWIDSELLPCIPRDHQLSAHCIDGELLTLDDSAFDSNNIETLTAAELTKLSCGGERPPIGVWPPPTT